LPGDKPLIADDVHRDLSRRFRMTRIHMVTGLAFLGPAWLSLIHAAEAITRGEWHHPSLLAAIHLFVVGYASNVVCGAILQIVPVVFQGRLYSIRLAYIQFVFMVLGSFSIPVGFLAKQWQIVTAGGTSVLIAFVLLFWNLGQTARTLKKRTEALGVMATFVFLFVTVLLGLGMASGNPPIDRVTLPVHIVIGVTGWFTTLILVLSPRLISFFVSSHSKKLRRSRPEFLLLAGISLVAIGFVLRVEGTVASLAMVMFLGGWILYFTGYLQLLINLYRHFRNRRRKEVEWTLKWIVGGLYGGILVLGVWAIVFTGFVQKWMLASSSLMDRITLSVTLLVIFGFLQWMIGAYMAKIMPFLRRMGRYSHGSAPETDQARKIRPPGVWDMLPRTPIVLALLGFAIGVVSLTAGVLIGQESLTLTGATTGTAAWVLYTAAMVVMYGR